MENPESRHVIRKKTNLKAHEELMDKLVDDARYFDRRDTETRWLAGKTNVRFYLRDTEEPIHAEILELGMFVYIVRHQVNLFTKNGQHINSEILIIPKHSIDYIAIEWITEQE